jgi:hypothetical protein
MIDGKYVDELNIDGDEPALIMIIIIIIIIISMMAIIILFRIIITETIKMKIKLN